MKTHLDQTLAEAVAELGADYPASVAAYEAIHLHILDMADLLSSGIIAPVPAEVLTAPDDTGKAAGSHALECRP